MRILAISLDLDDTLWPVEPAIRNAEQRLDEWLRAEHPDVADAAIVGVPDARLGEVGAAFVVLKSDAQLTEEQLLAWCDGRLARYKLPVYVRFVDALPRTVTGKVQKFELVREWTA